MKTPAYLQQFINKAALPLWKSNLWLRSLSSDSCQRELRPFLREQVSTSLKPPPPLALIAIPVGTLRKEIGVCLGHEDQLPHSLLQGSCCACGIAEAGRKLKCCVVDGLTLWWWGQGALGNWHRLVKQKHSWRERRKLFIRRSKFINFPLLLSIYFNSLLASSLLLCCFPFFLPLLLQQVKQALPCSFLGCLQL